jgi:sulfatase maturation enzyme AslB (radical SAM superfamily)
VPNNFCRYLSNGYSFTVVDNDLRVKPCCLYQQDFPVDKNLVELRNQTSNVTGWTKNCSICLDLEKAGQPSLRQSGPDWVNDSLTTEPASIDIQLDIDCNAACVTCNERSSSLWYKEKQKINLQSPKFHTDKTIVDSYVDQIVNTIKLDQVRYVKFYGGEPLFTDTHLRFLQHIPHPENVTLHYTTNGSIYPNAETLAIWKKFKVIIFAASLDGIEEQFNYVRWPLPWHKVSENLLRIKNNPDIWNVIFRVEFTANFLNAYYYDRLEKWVNDNLATNSSGDPTEINLHPCLFGTWDLDKMPWAVRELIIEKYPTDHVIHQLVAQLPKPTSLDNWQKFVELWDQRRNNSWKNAFPELAEYF